MLHKPDISLTYPVDGPDFPTQTSPNKSKVQEKELQEQRSFEGQREPIHIDTKTHLELLLSEVRWLSYMRGNFPTLSLSPSLDAHSNTTCRSCLSGKSNAQLCWTTSRVAWRLISPFASIIPAVTVRKYCARCLTMHTFLTSYELVRLSYINDKRASARKRCSRAHVSPSPSLRTCGHSFQSALHEPPCFEPVPDCHA